MSAPDLEDIRMNIMSARMSVEAFLTSITGVDFSNALTSVTAFTMAVSSAFSALYTAVVGASFWTDLVNTINNVTFTDALSTVTDFAEQIRAQFIRLFNSVTGQALEINFTNPDLRDQQRELEAEIGERAARSFNFGSFSMGISGAFNSITETSLSGFQSVLTGIVGLALIGGLLIGSIRRRIMGAFGFLIRTAYRTALANPIVAAITVGETFGNQIAEILGNQDFVAFGNNIAGVLTGRINLAELISGQEADQPLQTISVIASFDPNEAMGGQGSGTLALGAAIGRAAIDTIRGAVGGVFEGEGLSDSLGNLFELSMVAAFGLATVSSAFRGLVGDTLVDAFTGLGQVGFTGIGDDRRQLNLDFAEDQRIFARQQAFATAGGAIGALIAGSVVSELGGSDFAVVGSAIAGQILASFGTAAVLTRYGPQIGMLTGMIFSRAGVAAALAFVGTTAFWIGLGIVGALGAALILAFRTARGETDAESVLQERQTAAQQALTADITTAAAGSGVTLTQDQIAQLSAAMSIEEFNNIGTDLGLTADELDRILPAFTAFRNLLLENARGLRVLNNLQSQLAEAQANAGINQLGTDSFGRERALGDLAEVDRNFIALRTAIERNSDAVVSGARTEDLIAAFDSLTDEQQDAVRAAVDNNMALSMFGPLFSQSSEDLRISIENLTTAINNQLADLGLPELQTGGRISGPGTGTSDSILARVSNGEYVIRASSVRRYGLDFLDALNEGRLPRFQEGGPVERLRRTAGSLGLNSVDQANFNSLISAIEVVQAELEAERDIARMGIENTANIAAAQERLNEQLSMANDFLSGIAENTAATMMMMMVPLTPQQMAIAGRSINEQVEDIMDFINPDFTLNDYLRLDPETLLQYQELSRVRAELNSQVQEALDNNTMILSLIHI